MRAVNPTQSGQLKLAGYQIGYEVFGESSAPPVLLLPTWQIVHSRVWKMQVPWLARSFRVVTFDAAGNGRGERTTDPAAYTYDTLAEQAAGLLGHLGIARASVMGFSRGAATALLAAARFPERVDRLVLIGAGVQATNWPPTAPDPEFFETRSSYRGWEKYNAPYWRAAYRDFLEFFMHEVFSEPHSTKQIEDSIAWGLETTPEILIATHAPASSLTAEEMLARIQCRALLLHGGQDQVVPSARSESLQAARPDWDLVVLHGSGHAPHVRDAVRVNLEIETFLSEARPRRRDWMRAVGRAAKRALFISSPIGLGHVQRDLAIARELRRQAPDLQIDWLAQPPVSDVLILAGETIHPMSRFLASESAHWEAAAGEHELHCFQAFRDMDEILCANFMVFLEAVRATPYDLWVGDEAWDIDYYLHENPELKTAPFVFLTDFLGWIPTDRSADSREAVLTADYNAEMIEQVARFRRIRDRALYIGDYEDLPPLSFGPGLPLIPDWARENFSAVGYVAPFDPADFADTPSVRRRLGYDPDRPLVICAAGGTRVGRHLLGKAIAAWPLLQRRRPEIQYVVVGGPRIAPGSLEGQPDVRVMPYVHNLYEHLACADLGIVQGGLSTTMELTLNRRPFLYFPLRRHVEQEVHVACRLDRYRAGRRLTYAETSVEILAEAALGALGEDTSRYRPHTPGGAGRAAAQIAELL